MPRAKASHCLCRISLGGPRAPLPLRYLDFKWFTTSLIPAFSPRRRRIVRRLFENSRDWICRTAIRQTRNVQQLFPLLRERIKGEGGRQTQISFVPFAGAPQKHAILTIPCGFRHNLRFPKGLANCPCHFDRWKNVIPCWKCHFSIGHCHFSNGRCRIPRWKRRISIGVCRIPRWKRRISIGSYRNSNGHCRTSIGHYRTSIGHYRTSIGRCPISRHCFVSAIGNGHISSFRKGWTG